MNNFPTPRLTPARVEPPSPQESMINIATSIQPSRRHRTPISENFGSNTRPTTSSSVISTRSLRSPIFSSDHDILDTVLPVSREKKKKKKKKTSMPQLLSFNDSGTSYIVSIICKSNQVGIAAMNQRSNVMYVSECTETSVSFQYTKSLVREYSPHTLLFPTTAKNTNVVNELKKEFPQLKLQFIARRFFNESKGVSSIKHYCVPQIVILPDVSKKFLALSAFAALVDYTESVQGVEFSKFSFDIRYKSVNSHLLIDSITVKNLELIKNLKTGTIEHSLLSVIDFTKTPMGKRLLRTNILQPLTNIETIKDRQDATSELLSDESAYLGIVNSLKNVGDLEISMSKFTHHQLTFTSKTGERLLRNLIQLKQLLSYIPPVRTACRNFKSSLLSKIKKILENKEIEECMKDIDEYIDTDIKFTRNTLNMLTQMCFAVHQGKFGLLDVARRVYSDAVTEVHGLKKQLQDEAALNSLQLKYSTSRGYYFSVPVSEEIPERVKKKFVTCQKRGKRNLVSTQELIHLNRRISTTLDEVYLQSAKALEELVEKINKRIHIFSKVSESIGLLDLLQSFASLSIMRSNYCRPKLTEDGPLAIKLGRHPLIDSEGGLGAYIPNHTFISSSSNFQILTGPNNSGKTTYVKQVGCIVILAQIGCWVPATFCSARIFKRVLTKLSINSSLAANCSTFMVEMREISQIVQNATEFSLVLIDELGRGTSHLEGVSIAWAISEHLINLGAFTFFVTHYMKLCGLSALYPNVKNYHFQVCVTRKADQLEDEGENKCLSHHLNFMYRLLEGSTSMDRYGINLARMVGFPKDVLDEAEKVFKKLIQIEETKKEKNKLMEDDEQMKLKKKEILELKQRFDIGERIHRLKYSTLDIQGKIDYLKRLKQKLIFGEVEENTNEIIGKKKDEMDKTEE